jgi:hypothetical protein
MLCSAATSETSSYGFHRRARRRAIRRLFSERFLAIPDGDAEIRLVQALPRKDAGVRESRSEGTPGDHALAFGDGERDAPVLPP